MLDSLAAHSSDSSSLASLSSDLYDSPPSPPTTLKDQVQASKVTSDNDPRIDEVCDKDFNVYFVPSGPLTLEDADRRAMEETQCKQREWAEKSQRSMQLKVC
ncbi:hypothetical protein F5J12DRAFT_887594 [Pisolithus orientalis]|uniref:uncharacterized protein n=1 Tax=Pisolithus orientalis TaxID=936130 RepID=UPI002224238A|nr:uncharacterized protein F5J12DRAFT_887594 [Pisolithus orientalis]KAI6032698.1 hypothetical protein F5J12DRAFT_887594 [Pisolithus orientalis]